MLTIVNRKYHHIHNFLMLPLPSSPEHSQVKAALQFGGTADVDVSYSQCYSSLAKGVGADTKT